MTTTDTHAERDKQIRQAEELFFSGPKKASFAKGLFFGRFIADWVMPYPQISADEQPRVDAAVADVRRFSDEKIDAAAIDRNADIPRSVIDGLSELGVLGMTAPVDCGGRGFSQSAYCRVMEVIGGHCASTSVFVNAHHSIGIRALVLFGTPEQKRRWLPDLVNARKLAAFALTEPEAGSDAGNVQTRATPSADGSHFLLTGEKRYITNGSIAQVLTVMARTPAPGKPEGVITAFLVTPDMPGFRVTEARMEKLGIRGTTTSRLAFDNMPVPRENILGPEGKGLKVALTVLDFGRTTFGACCTGGIKTALKLAVAHAGTRRQFNRTLGSFELVKKKLARIASDAYAMEAMTMVTANLIDRGMEDYMLETAMLKVFATEALWSAVHETFQIHGGPAYFTDRPIERMMRDARINLIGEGANDVLRSFIALVGMRGPGEELREVWEALHWSTHDLRKVWHFGIERAREAVHSPHVPVQHHSLRAAAHQVGDLVRSFEFALGRTLIHHREEIIERQYVQERIAECAIELFASACVLSRLDAELSQSKGDEHACAQITSGVLFLHLSARRIRQHLAAISENDDSMTTRAADAILAERKPPTQS